jgi:hypothetical protein
MHSAIPRATEESTSTKIPLKVSPANLLTFYHAFRLNTELKSEEGRIDRVTKFFSDSPPLVLGEASADLSPAPAAPPRHPISKAVLHPATHVTQLSDSDLVSEGHRSGGGAVGGRERAEAEAASFAHLTAGARDPHAAAKARLVRKVRRGRSAIARRRTTGVAGRPASERACCGGRSGEGGGMPIVIEGR